MYQCHPYLDIIKRDRSHMNTKRFEAKLPRFAYLCCQCLLTYCMPSFCVFLETALPLAANISQLLSLWWQTRDSALFHRIPSCLEFGWQRLNTFLMKKMHSLILSPQISAPYKTHGRIWQSKISTNTLYGICPSFHRDLDIQVTFIFTFVTS